MQNDRWTLKLMVNDFQISNVQYAIGLQNSSGTLKLKDNDVLNEQCALCNWTGNSQM